MQILDAGCCGRNHPSTTRGRPFVTKAATTPLMEICPISDWLFIDLRQGRVSWGHHCPFSFVGFMTLLLEFRGASTT